jgi:hypothetical protein
VQYLFNIDQDPFEMTNLMDDEPEITGAMYERLSEYVESAVESAEVVYSSSDTTAAFSEWEKFGDTIVPWDFTYCADFVVSGCQR